ncbi:hypothetical protein, partial [Intestinimonas sp. HCP28S3_D6]|uniref:hypothetical protein n=1 Tax=Intestinimonas sp. HCP28S3_D6 TaxID=3438942 RepID=UPI003F8C1A6C
HEHEALGGGSGRRLYCRLTSFSRSLQIILRINLDGTALNNRDFVVWTRHFVSLLSLIGGWGGVLPPHFGQKKSRRPFSDFLLGVPLCERRVFSCKSSGQVDPM